MKNKPQPHTPLAPSITTMNSTTKPLPAIGDTLNVALHSTGAAKLTITHTGMTAEVNGAELRDNGQGQWVIAATYSGMPVNTSLRVPVCLATDAVGRTHAIALWYDKWLGIHHRKLQFCREWETADGSDLDPEFAAFVDAVLASRNGAASDAEVLKWWRKSRNVWEISQLTGLPESRVTAIVANA